MQMTLKLLSVEYGAIENNLLEITIMELLHYCIHQS